MVIQFPCTMCCKAVGTKHRAIKCDICDKWIHIKCNKLDKKDYTFSQNNPEQIFYCIKCTAASIPFMSLNDNHFNIAVTKGINCPNETEVRFDPSPSDKLIYDKLNQAINAFDPNEENNKDEIATINCKYYSNNEFISAKFKQDKTFSILHLNIHSAELHIDELRITLEMLNFKFDIICLSESKIHKDIEPKIDINIPGYQPPVGTPTESSKGGVLIYVKEGINFIPRTDLNIYKEKQLESFFIEIANNKGKNSIIGVIYRHPCMEENIFNNDFLKNLTEKLSTENKKHYISGDFNYDLLNISTHEETLCFFDTMMSNFLMPTITLPTKINTGKSSVIDNIFTNQIHPDMMSGNLTIGISDHLPSFMIVPRDNQSHLPKQNNIYTRKVKNFDRENFLLEYFDLKWDVILQTEKNDVNYSLNKFMTKINILLDKYMPLRKINKKEFRRRYKPWISDEILSKIDNKNRLFKKYVKCKNSERKIELNNNYKTQKNEITNLTRQSKKAYYDKYFTENKNNLKKIWQGIKNIINIKSKNQDHPTCLISEEKTISDPTEMAGKFNDFFTSVADNILKKKEICR